MKTLVPVALLLLGTLAAGVACAPATEGVPVTKGVGLVQKAADMESVDIDDPDEPNRPRPTPFNTLAPEEIPEGVSRALAQDAQWYAAHYGVELSEAIKRLTLQETIGELGATLESYEKGTLGGVWIQHEPEYRIVAAFTRDGEETIAKYVQDGPLVDIIEVRTVDATLGELKRSQRDAGSMVRGLGFQVASDINVFENRAEIYVHDLAQVEEALEKSGKTLPEHVRIFGLGLPKEE